MSTTNLTNFPLFAPVLSEDSLMQYTAYVTSLPLLTEEQEYELFVDYKTNKSKNAANAIILAHLRIVVVVARRFAEYGFCMVDLISEGNYGLLKALKKFDHKKGIRFVTYALWWVRSSIQEYIAKNWSVVQSGGFSKYRKQLFSKLEDGFSVKKDSQIEVMQLSSTSQENISDAIDREIQIESVNSALETLSKKERDVIEMRFLADQTMTLEKVSKKLGISAERVRQIQESAKNKLKKRIF